MDGHVMHPYGGGGGDAFYPYAPNVAGSTSNGYHHHPSAATFIDHSVPPPPPPPDTPPQLPMQPMYNEVIEELCNLCGASGGASSPLNVSSGSVRPSLGLLRPYQVERPAHSHDLIISAHEACLARLGGRVEEEEGDPPLLVEADPVLVGRLTPETLCSICQHVGGPTSCRRCHAHFHDGCVQRRLIEGGFLKEASSVWSEHGFECHSCLAPSPPAPRERRSALDVRSSTTSSSTLRTAHGSHDPLEVRERESRVSSASPASGGAAPVAPALPPSRPRSRSRSRSPPSHRYRRRSPTPPLPRRTTDEAAHQDRRRRSRSRSPPRADHHRHSYGAHAPSSSHSYASHPYSQSHVSYHGYSQHSSYGYATTPSYASRSRRSSRSRSPVRPSSIRRSRSRSRSRERDRGWFASHRTRSPPPARERAEMKYDASSTTTSLKSRSPPRAPAPPPPPPPAPAPPSTLPFRLPRSPIPPPPAASAAAPRVASSQVSQGSASSPATHFVVAMPSSTPPQIALAPPSASEMEDLLFSPPPPPRPVTPPSEEVVGQDEAMATTPRRIVFPLPSSSVSSPRTPIAAEFQTSTGLTIAVRQKTLVKLPVKKEGEVVPSPSPSPENETPPAGRGPVSSATASRLLRADRYNPAVIWCLACKIQLPRDDADGASHLHAAHTDADQPCLRLSSKPSEPPPTPTRGLKVVLNTATATAAAGASQGDATTPIVAPPSCAPFSFALVKPERETVAAVEPLMSQETRSLVTHLLSLLPDERWVGLTDLGQNFLHARGVTFHEATGRKLESFVGAFPHAFEVDHLKQSMTTIRPRVPRRAPSSSSAPPSTSASSPTARVWFDERRLVSLAQSLLPVDGTQIHLASLGSTIGNHLRRHSLTFMAVAHARLAEWVHARPQHFTYRAEEPGWVGRKLD